MTRCGLLMLTLALPLWAAPVPTPEWGEVAGWVTFKGNEIPVQKPIKGLPGIETLTKQRDQPLLEEQWIVNAKNRGVKNVFVWLEPEGNKPMPIHPKLVALPNKPVELNTKLGQYEPHCLAFREGQDLLVKNNCVLTYNVRLRAQNYQDFNQLFAPASETTLKKLSASPAVLVIDSGIHLWMRAYARVFKHPYFALTDADGKFTIKDAPPGVYRLVVWHEQSGWGPGGKAGTLITIHAGRVCDPGKLELPLRKD